VDGLPVQDIATFQKVMASYVPGMEVKLEIQRGEELITKPVTLIKRAEQKK
jgi:S1-C subfamily serine protease